MTSSTREPSQQPNHNAPHHTITFEHMNKYWFNEQRNPPLVLLRDVVGRTDTLLEGLIHEHSDFLSIFIVQHGRGKHVVQDTTYEAARGDVFVMGQGTWHQY